MDVSRSGHLSAQSQQYICSAEHDQRALSIVADKASRDSTPSASVSLDKSHHEPFPFIANNQTYRPRSLSETMIHAKLSQDENEKALSLKEFYKKMSATDKVTVVVGGGTAALTYLATKRFDEADTHILVLGTAGYWGDKVAHRLAQPHHIFALPHQENAGFIDPSEHDKRNGLLPHDTSSAYVHSRSYQSRLVELEKTTLDSLRRQGK